MWSFWEKSFSDITYILLYFLFLGPYKLIAGFLSDQCSMEKYYIYWGLLWEDKVCLNDKCLVKLKLPTVRLGVTLGRLLCAPRMTESKDFEMVSYILREVNHSEMEMHPLLSCLWKLWSWTIFGSWYRMKKKRFLMYLTFAGWENSFCSY